MIPLYLDEDSEDNDLAAALRRAHLHVLTAYEAGNHGLPDSAQLEFAASRGLSIVTANVKDFRPLDADWARSGRVHAGIILRVQRVDLREEIRRLTRLATSLEPEQMLGSVEFLSRWR